MQIIKDEIRLSVKSKTISFNGLHGIAFTLLSNTVSIYQLTLYKKMNSYEALDDKGGRELRYLLFLQVSCSG